MYRWRHLDNYISMTTYISIYNYETIRNAIIKTTFLVRATAVFALGMQNLLRAFEKKGKKSIPVLRLMRIFAGDI